MNKNFDPTLQVGWIADDVEKVIPELVYQDTKIDDKEAYKGVAYARSCAIIAEALKELRAETKIQFDELKQQIMELKLENKKLKNNLVE